MFEIIQLLRRAEKPTTAQALADASGSLTREAPSGPGLCPAQPAPARDDRGGKRFAGDLLRLSRHD